MIPVFDKYADYIWSSYGITAAVLLLVLIWALRSNRRTREELERFDSARNERGPQ